MSKQKPFLSALVIVLSALGSTVLAEEAEVPHFRLGGEMKSHFRNSKSVTVRDRFPFPPSFLPPGEDSVFLRTVDPGSSAEISTVSLKGEGELTSGVAAKIEVHFLDLYNRNPTSSDDRIQVREAWVRFGRQPETFQASTGHNSVYVLVGLAPRFSKQQTRRLESYGLWGTAVGRFEQPQVQAGGTLGRNVYWRTQAGNGNPVFFRDPNALAGDNGTPERQPGSSVHPIYESGFPILYDAKPTDLNFNGKFEWGAGLGFRGSRPSGAIDVLGWYFRRQLADVVRLNNTTYSGDIKLLKGVVIPLPFEGHTKWEFGVNVEARCTHGGRLFAQYVRQDIAKLARRGFEAELSWRFGLNGLFLVGESPVGNWVQPVLRVSTINNLFETPALYPGPSVGWDWRKYDLGVRVGLVRDVDLTVEYSRHDMKVPPTLHPDEALVTLRAGF